MEKKFKRRSIQLPPDDYLSEQPKILQRIYAARGVSHSSDLDYHLKNLLPFEQLKGIDKAVERLEQALLSQERVLIVGDFDADGATSSALAVSALTLFGFKQVQYLVPNRFEYGYGLTPEIVLVGKQWDPDIIITVDNGIASFEGVAEANKHHIDVIITDHHLPGKTLPDAVAIINPNQEGCQFPSKNLAGVGVIFYTMLALRRHLLDKSVFTDATIPNMAQFLDLVALGTVADVVPLDKNNRLLVQQGLKRIQSGKARPGIAALLQIAKRSVHTIVAADLGFAIGPRLNAAGRLDDMALGIECLLATDTMKALAMAEQLDSLNQERKSIETDMQREAMLDLKKLSLGSQSKMPKGLCLYDPSWHQGVIGILASRVKDRYHRPVIAFAHTDDEYLKGSARSINGVHIRDVLDAVATKHPEIISKFGGHAMAAGLSLHKNNLTAFKHAFNEQLETQITENMLQAVIETDGELSHDDFDLDLVEKLRHSGPWGQGFPDPIFDGVFSIISQRLVGKKHLKMVLQPENNMIFIDAIAFNIDIEQWPNERIKKIAVAYKLDVNEYMGRRSIQIMVEAMKVIAHES